MDRILQLRFDRRDYRDELAELLLFLAGSAELAIGAFIVVSQSGHSALATLGVVVFGVAGALAVAFILRQMFLQRRARLANVWLTPSTLRICSPLDAAEDLVVPRSRLAAASVRVATPSRRRLLGRRRTVEPQGTPEPKDETWPWLARVAWRVPARRLSKFGGPPNLAFVFSPPLEVESAGRWEDLLNAGRSRSWRAAVLFAAVEDPTGAQRSLSEWGIPPVTDAVLAPLELSEEEWKSARRKHRLFAFGLLLSVMAALMAPFMWFLRR